MAKGTAAWAKRRGKIEEPWTPSGPRTPLRDVDHAVDQAVHRGKRDEAEFRALDRMPRTKEGTIITSDGGKDDRPRDERGRFASK